MPAENENKIRKVIFNEITILMTVVTFFGGLILAYANIMTKLALIEQDLNTVKTNELVHIQAAMEKLEVRNAAADERQEKMELQITRILTIMGKEL